MPGTEAELAVFKQAMAKAGAASAPETAAAVTAKKDTRVPPEMIWQTGRAVKEKKEAEKAAKAAEATPETAAPERSLDGKFTTPEKQQEQFDDAKFELARNALARSGWKKKELDAMEPEELVKRGLARAKALEKDDEAHRIAKELREAKGKEQSTGKPEQVSKPAPVKLPEWNVPESLKQALTLDDTGAKALKQTFDEFASLVSEATAAPLRERIAEFERTQQQAGARSEAELIESAREEVGKRFPDLRDPETFEKVVEDVRLLVNRPKYQQIASLAGRVNACFVDACKLNELQPAESDSKAQDDAARLARRSNGSTVGDRSRPAAMTQKERDREVFDELRAKHGLD